jgi:flagellar protein FlgJ
MSISIGGSDLTTSNYYNAPNSGTSSTENSIENITLTNPTDEKLMAACKEYETYFVEQMYKAMEKTVIKADEDSENQYEAYFGDMRVKDYADKATEGDGVGIAKALYEQMKRNYTQ